jgi:signal transduction histidine kinase
VEGRLLNLGFDRGDQVLELEAGTRGFIARLETRRGLLRNLALGSRLELTGVYLGRGGDHVSGRDIDSFELLLNSPGNIRVLARAPWWTVPNVLAALGVVAAILLGAMLWVFSLRRRVRAQTEIIQQKALREATLEERTRIAKDIHDDLGSSLTFITMLGERLSEDRSCPGELAAHADKIVGYARGAVQALDEIVWAVNPRNDTLDGLVGYLNQYACQFFENTTVRCRLEIPETLPDLMLRAEARHDLFLAVKEALNNVVKHAQASEVSVSIAETAGRLEIIVKDNGRGFDAGKTRIGSGGNGLENMRKRMARIGGSFCLISAPGQGATLGFTVSLRGLSSRAEV